MLILKSAHCMEAGMSETSGMYYNLITIVNDDSRVVRMLLQVVASPMIDTLMTLKESSLMTIVM
jgi:hypothetical protein